MKIPALLVPALLAVHTDARAFSVELYKGIDCTGTGISVDILSEACNWFDKFPFRSFVYVADNSRDGEPVQEMRLFANSECDASNETHAQLFPHTATSLPFELLARCATQPCRVFSENECYNTTATNTSAPAMSIWTYSSDITDEKCGPFFRLDPDERCDNPTYQFYHPEKFPTIYPPQ